MKNEIKPNEAIMMKPNMIKQKIEIPKGYEIDLENSIHDGYVVFREIKKELPKSWEELKKIDGYYVGIHAELIRLACPSITRDDNRNIFPTKEQAEASVALAQLSQLREVYRQGWNPDWNDVENKYCIVFSDERFEVWRNQTTTRFFSFQSKEIAEQFLENFRDLIEKVKPLMS